MSKLKNDVHSSSCSCCDSSGIEFDKHHHDDGDGCESSGHDHENGEHNIIIKILRISVSLIIMLIGIFVSLPPIYSLILFIIAYAIIGYDILWNSLKNILKGKIFDENFLMTIASIGAFLIGENAEGCAVMLFYQLGEFLQDLTVDHSKKNIAKLIDIRAEYANVLIGNEIQTKDPETVQIGETIIIKTGEKVPIDGIIISGSSSLDTKALSGESLPREVSAGDEIYSGSINLQGLLTVKTTKTFDDSTVSKILDLIENASSKKAPTEKFITKFAKIYTPIVFLAAVLIAVIPGIITGNFSEWINKALIFLVISCPCALVISIPLGFIGGIGAASKNGILVKGSNYLEALTKISAVVFDKTGTLTKGVFEITEINCENGFEKKEILKYAAHAEFFSNHPIAKTIKNSYTAIDQTQILEYNEIAGNGISAKIFGYNIIAGNEKLMLDNNIIIKSNISLIGSNVYIAKNGQLMGIITVSDTLKQGAAETISTLKKSGIENIAMFTGDNKKTGEYIAEQLGISEVYTELLPNEKVDNLEKIKERKKNKETEKIIFVGDGINDAPVLAGADIGIAMGGLGSDAAIESADIILMTDEITKIITAIDIAKKTKRIVWQNIILAFSIKLLVLGLGTLGFATMWEAVIADVGVALLAILNAMRLIKMKNFK